MLRLPIDNLSLLQVVRFCVAGSAGVVVYYVVLYGLTEYAGFWYVASSVIGSVLSTVVNFLLQKFWTFQNKETHLVGRQLVLYSAMSAFFFFGNTIALYLLVTFLHLWYIAAQVIVTVVISVSSFGISRRIFSAAAQEKKRRPMFQTKSGMTRWVILLGPIVLKFPHLTYGLQSFWTGVIANISEFAIWQCMKGKATFLTPTLFTFFGFVNIQLRECGEMVLGRELEQRYRLLDHEAQRFIPQLGGHALHPANWVRNERGYRLVDYGDTFISEYTQLSGFLQMFHQQLSPILMAEPDESRLSEESLNELGYLRLVEDQEWRYAHDGKWIAISRGRMIAEADDRDSLFRQLRDLNIAQMTRIAVVGEEDDHPEILHV